MVPDPRRRSWGAGPGPCRAPDPLWNSLWSPDLNAGQVSIMPTRSLLVLMVLGLTLCPLSGQAEGQGIPSATGIVPWLEVQHLAVGQANQLALHGFAPGAAVSLVVAFTASPTPLASLGYGPAIFGPDPQSPAGAALFSGLVADANGDLVLPFTGQPAFSHWTVHMQAFAPDGGAVWGAAISEHARFMFGLDREKVPVAIDAGNGRETLLEAFAYGALARPLDPRLVDLDFLPIVLANSNEMAFARDDRPTQAVPGEPEAGLVLPGDLRLYHAQQADGRSGFFLRRPDGSLDVLAWAQGSLLQPAFLVDVAASAHAPYIVVGAENPLPEYDNATLVLLRTDGRNVPGSHRNWFPIATPGGYAAEALSACFLAGALVFGDGGTRLDRLDLQTFTVSPIVLPPSGGQTPVYVDEVCAPAADGSALAIGAGLDKNQHDVYVVTAAGLATNLSNLPGDYEDAGPGLGDGMQMAMADDGSQVAYMRTVTETELFVKGTAPGAPELQVTHAGQYINSIDTVVGLGFKTGAPEILFSAGKSDTAVDAYDAVVPASGAITQISNLSQTSGFTAPVFGLGATLDPRRAFSTPQGRLLEFANTAGPDRLQIVGAGATLAIDVVALGGGAPVANDYVLLDQPAAGAFRLRAVDVGAASLGMTWQSTAGSSLGGLVETSGLVAVLTEAPGGGALAVYDGAGLQVAAAPAGNLGGGLHLTASGRLMTIATDPSSGLVTIVAFDRAAGTWSTLSTMNLGTTAARFLR